MNCTYRGEVLLTLESPLRCGLIQKQLLMRIQDQVANSNCPISPRTTKHHRDYAPTRSGIPTSRVYNLLVLNSPRQTGWSHRRLLALAHHWRRLIHNEPVVVGRFRRQRMACVFVCTKRSVKCSGLSAHTHFRISVPDRLEISGAVRHSMVWCLDLWTRTNLLCHRFSGKL